MRTYTVSGVRSAAVLGILFAAAISLPAQQGARRETQKAEQAFENIKVLRGTPAEDFNQTMHLISGQLGVNCEFCHPEKDRVSDEIEAKRTAREMIKMTADLNKRSFKGEQVITCYTCHQGRPVPLNTPVLPNTEFPLEEKSTKQLPAPAEILAKYINALGGEQKLRSVTSRVVTATQDVPAGPGGVNPVPGTTERYQKTPNLLLNVYHTAKFTSSNGYDGKRAWAQAANGRVAEPPPLEQVRTARAAEVLEPLQLQQTYARMTVEGVEKINGRDAYLLVGYPKENIPERLYFDTQTGLLLRKSTVVPTATGNSPYQVDYDDYRDTNSGVKYPFLIHMDPASPRLELVTQSTIHVKQVQDNVPIDDAKFVKPISKEPPPAPTTAAPKAGGKKKS